MRTKAAAYSIFTVALGQTEEAPLVAILFNGLHFKLQDLGHFYGSSYKAAP
jgi:hypothetical protein